MAAKRILKISILGFVVIASGQMTIPNEALAANWNDYNRQFGYHSNRYYSHSLSKFENNRLSDRRRDYLKRDKRPYERNLHREDCKRTVYQPWGEKRVVRRPFWGVFGRY
ncbi:MAG: hypothetical protein KDD42_09105 [Bdellovibrionales bacterium]|nr:hypothetical protein [Bdellovibrionales bacterium]